jgi:hypothetical protein
VTTLRPALLTGTSTEFLGRRPRPRVVAERRVVIVLGSPGVGKSSVARSLAGTEPRVVDTRALQEALVHRVRSGEWPDEIVAAEALVLDGPEHLVSRVQALEWVTELLCTRDTAGLRTAVVESPGDRSVDALIGRIPAGVCVVIGLRFPAGQRGRVRFARRLCDARGLPHRAAAATARLEPWTYRRVKAYLDAWTPEGTSLG